MGGGVWEQEGRGVGRMEDGGREYWEKQLAWGLGASLGQPETQGNGKLPGIYESDLS